MAVAFLGTTVGVRELRERQIHSELVETIQKQLADGS
jgi:hypothetical protein